MDNGVLVGVVRRSVLEAAGPDVTISELMEAPISVPWDAPIGSLDSEMCRGPGPIPVVDQSGRLIGALATAVT